MIPPIMRFVFQVNGGKLDGIQFPHGVKLQIGEIIEWPTPRNVMELKSFLSICTYYRKFVKGFSELTTPLIDLTKKGAFV
jgi:hypothetical protein